ncbi:MAG TPA: epoxide hydrolase [Opitutaceae bacterium]|nr:epoxide hydrolase [Opitutaceae bacterium]
MFVRRFEVHFPEERLVALRARLTDARWPKVRPGSGWTMGTDEAFLHRLVDYWLTRFDWRKQEAALNRLPQFVTEIDGRALHFVHMRSREEDARPLLLAHGWPASFALYADLIPRLTDPVRFGGEAVDAFDVVLPSLPGFIFSDPFPDGGPRGRIADLWHELMSEVLGYPRFAAAGGDIGSDVVTQLALRHAGSLTGIHLTDVRDPWLGPRAAPLTLAEETYRNAQAAWYAAEGGYDAIQTTKPQTLAYALNDSPLGAAAWIVEKMRAWSDCGGDVERRFSLDQLLTNITLYLATDTLATSLQLYFDRVNHPQGFAVGERVATPTAVALFPAETPANPPREYAERAYNIRRWTPMPRGGHFPFAEEPDLLAEDIRAFFRR